MENIILTTTASYFKTVEETDLKEFLAKLGLKVILAADGLKPPFNFDAAKVVGLVAGHTPKGDVVKGGYCEAKLVPNLKMVTPFGVGTDHIDRDGLARVGVEAKTLPPISKRAVAELAMGFILNLARRINIQTLAMKSGVWERVNGTVICEKTLGIIGLGNIGKKVAKMARHFGMKVLANDLVYDEAFMKNFRIEKADFDTLLVKSDFITLHVPFTEKTNNIINKDAVAKMKRGVFIVNTSRGAVVNEAALLEALQSGQVAGAALDVFSVEPPFKNETISSLIRHSNVITTPHIGAYTPEIRYAIAKKVSEEILSAV